MTDNRTEANAPETVRREGGVVLSLWLTGANEMDVLLVADMQAELNNLRLEQIAAAR